MGFIRFLSKEPGGALLLTYPFLATRSRLERRSEWAVRLISRLLPGRLGERAFFVFCSVKLTTFLVEVAVFAAATFVLLKLTSPQIVLSLLFAFLLTIGGLVGLTTSRWTTLPFDRERLLAAPVSDRKAHSLTFLSAGSLGLLDSAVVSPLVVGITASIFFAQAPFLMLWTVIVLTALASISLAYILDRVSGTLQVLRTQRGVRGPSLFAYAFSAAVAFVVGTLIAKATVPWLTSVSWDRVLSIDELSNPNDSLSLLPSFLDGLSSLFFSSALPFAEGVLTHPANPAGLLARATLGDQLSLLLATTLTAAVVLAAVAVSRGSGWWYRSDWLSGWQNWKKGDLFDLAEGVYLKAARTLRGEDALLETQIRNLCQRREWVVATVADLVGGGSVWVWVGVAFGAAPALQSSPHAAAVFALLVGRVVGGDYGSLALYFRESLALDAEGRRIRLYRAAGMPVFRLFSTKLLLSRIVGVLPLLVALTTIILVAGLSVLASVLLLTAGVSALLLESRVMLLPGLISPHFDWDHPSEMADYMEQQWATKKFGGLETYVFALQAGLLAVLLVKDYVEPTTFMWAALSSIVLTTAVFETVLNRASRKWANFIDTKDLVI